MGNKVVTCDLPLPLKQKHLSTYMNPEQIHLVQASWDLIKDDLAKLGMLVFLKFFETEPDMKALFPKIVQINNENKLEWAIDREMLRKHAVTAMEGLGAAVESLDDCDFLNGVLISIGQAHFHRNVRPSMLKRLWPALHYGLQDVLQETYTREVSDAWKKVFDYVCMYMKFGMEHPEIDTEYEVTLSRLS